MDDAVFGPGMMASVITAPEGFVAVGELCLSAGCRATVWRSPDGAEWSRAFVDPLGHPEASPDGTWFHDAAVNELGYLAVGSTYHVWFSYPVFAISADGVRWERIEPLPREHLPTDDPEGILLDTSAPLSVAGADDAFLVAGQSCEHVGPQAYDCRGVIWRSDDGIVWTKVLEDASNSAFASIEKMADRYLAVGGAGVGLDLQPDVADDGVVRMWSSFDGITWSDVSSDPSVFGSDRPDPQARELARAVTAVDEGIVVGGSPFEDPEGTIWFSEDGTSWARLPADEAFANATITGIDASGDMVIAVGAEGSEPELAAAWRSDDGGMTWTGMHIDSALTGHDSRFRDVAILGDITVAGLSVDGEAAIWALDLGSER